MIGHNFGIFPNALTFTESQQVTVAFGNAERGFTLECTDVVRLNHSTLDCTLPEGSGADLFARIIVAGQEGLSPMPVLSYDPPVVSKMSIVHLPAISTTMLSPPQNVKVVRTPGMPFIIGGPTEGGYTLVLEGENFGTLSHLQHCVFLAWVSRVEDPQTCGSNAFDREHDAFIGEGKVSATGVISHTHRRIELIVPPGMGHKDIVLLIGHSSIMMLHRLWEV